MNSHPAEGLRSLPRIRAMEESPVSSLEPGSCPFRVIINFISGFTRCGLQKHALLVHSSFVERMEPTQASFPSRGRLGHREETVCHLSDGGTPTQWPKAGSEGRAADALILSATAEKEAPVGCVQGERLRGCPVCWPMAPVSPAHAFPPSPQRRLGGRSYFSQQLQTKLSPEL